MLIRRRAPAWNIHETSRREQRSAPLALTPPRHICSTSLSHPAGYQRRRSWCVDSSWRMYVCSRLFMLHLYWFIRHKVFCGATFRAFTHWVPLFIAGNNLQEINIFLNGDQEIQETPCWQRAILLFCRIEGDFSKLLHNTSSDHDGCAELASRNFAQQHQQQIQLTNS